MGLSLGDTVLRLSADGRPLEQGLNKAKGDITAFAGSFGSLTVGGTGLSGALAAGLAGFKDVLGTLKEKVLEFFDSFKQTSQLSQELGIPINDLVALRLGVENAGQEFAVVEKGLKTFTKTLADARAEDQNAIGSFAAMGVALKDLKGVDAGEAFLRTVDAISQIKDPTDKARAAMEAFGDKAALKLLPIIDKGRAGIEELKEQAAKLGLTVDALDLERIEQADNAMDMVRASVKGLVQQLAIQLAPAITSIAEFIKEVTIELTQFFKNAKEFFQDFSNAIAQVAAQAGEFVGFLPEGTSKTLDEDIARFEKLRELQKATVKEGTPLKINDIDEGRLGKQKKLMDEVIGLATQLGPLDSFSRKMQGLDLLLDQGRITWEQYANAVNKASDELVKQAGLNEIKTPSALVKGSVDATSAIIKAELSQQVRNDPAAQLRAAMAEAKRIQEGQLEVAKQQLTALNKIADKEPIEVDEY